MNQTRKAYINIHIAVVLFGFTAILGALIDMSAIMIVWWRVLITCISLLGFISFGKTLKAIPKKYIIKFCMIGVIVGAHWICFYGAIKLANSSIALICMATTTLFTSILEPIIHKRRINYLDFIIGILIVPAMALIVNTTELSMRWGILVGLLSAFLASLFGILNKKYIDKADFYSITFLELGGATLFISLVIPFISFQSEAFLFFPPTINDWFYLIVLALACTTFAYVLSLKALKYISAFDTNLILSLEPVYGILLAILLLKEHKELNLYFYIGSTFVLLAVFSYPFLKKRFNKAP